MDMTEIRRLEEQKVGTLRLSEAIRIGAKLRPQCRNEYFTSDGGSCALGAAWEGAGREGEPRDYEDVCRQFRIPKAFAEDIARMNDQGDSREQIADYVQAQGY